MTNTKHYKFSTAEEANHFFDKYSKIWHLAKPFQTLSGWRIVRYI